MNIEKILKYQKVDEQMYKLEQKLAGSETKKKANEYASIAKKAQAKSVELEAESAKFIVEIEKIQKNFDISQKALNSLKNSDPEKMTLEEIEKMETLRKKVVNNLTVLEKALQKSAESVNRIISEFNAAKKTYDKARVQFDSCKQALAVETKAIEAEKTKVREELSSLEKEIDDETLSAYKKRRADGIFPVVVPLENGSFCGRCRMELAKVAISRIKEKGVITCEHCKRYVYNPTA